MRNRATYIGPLVALLCGCQKAQVSDEQTAVTTLDAQYEAWANRQPRPSVQIVNRIEALLSKEPCIGRLANWSRSYAYNYDSPTELLYKGLVDFHFKQADTPGNPPGRKITEPNSWISIDDSPIRMAWGDYDIQTDTIRMGFCGNNVGGAPSNSAPERLNNYYDDLERRRKSLEAVRAS